MPDRPLSSRVLLIPLDDRPPCLQFPVRMGLVGDVEVVTPPRGLLGRFTEFGKSDEIYKWVLQQDLPRFDAAIVSIDMAAYGGLVASRVFDTPTEDALRRIELVREMRRRAPRLKIYGSSVIMRLAPTADGKNDAFRDKLSKWAEIAADPAERSEIERLESEIPAAALKNYKLARERNLKVNRAAVDFVASRTLDYLILSQDDAKPRGVHLAERESLIAYAAEKNLSDRVAIQPGADEVSMLLLSRALTDKYRLRPRIRAVYSSDQMADRIMPYEDRPLRKTVSFHIQAAGGIETTDETTADIIYFVYASRAELGAAERFAARINATATASAASRASASRPAILVADIDPKGDVQGADPRFSEELLRYGLFDELAGYASWNTAGNTIGTALPHGMLRWAASNNFGSTLKAGAEFRLRIAESQTWFMMNRLLDDYVYHSVVRPEALAFSRTRGWSSRYTDTEARAFEAFAAPRVFARLNELMKAAVPAGGGISCSAVTGEQFTLPWNRAFEAEINFRPLCRPMAAKPKSGERKNEN